jgi:hypothetical protein
MARRSTTEPIRIGAAKSSIKRTLRWNAAHRRYEARHNGGTTMVSGNLITEEYHFHVTPRAL